MAQARCWRPPSRWRSFRPCRRPRPGQIPPKVETTRGCCCSLCRCLNLQEQFVCSMCMLVAAAEAQTSYCRVIKLCFLSSCFEYQDLFVGNRIAYPSESYFLWKVMSEVSVSRRHRSPLARSALPLTCTLYSYLSAGFCYRYSREGMKIILAEKFSSVRTCSVAESLILA
jgi:hypothetical protein